MIEIHIYGPQSMIKNYPRRILPVVDKVTSYPVQGAEWSKAYRKGLWDGRKRLFRKRTGAFPTGLVPAVTEALRGLEEEVQIIDHRSEPVPSEQGFELQGVTFEYPYDYQLDTCKKMVEKKQGIVKIATNGGKCLATNTPVRMYDGSVKYAKDIKVGDQLMGPDSRPRNVLSTNTGYGPMYEIRQKRGMTYRCNDVHVLTLQDTSYKRAKNKIIDIPLNEYLVKSNHFKHRYKHFSVGVEYPYKEVPVDPHFVGLWLGDGAKDLNSVAITTADVEITNHLQRIAADWGCYISEDDHNNNAASTYFLRTPRGQNNDLLKAMRQLFPVLRIPKDYLCNSRDVRLSLLSGILDSDGYYDCGRNRYEITQKNEELIYDIYLLVRSLGFSVSLPKPKIVKDKTYWRIQINNITKGSLHTLLRYKRSNKEACSTNRTKFDVEYIGEDFYSGFTLDGDGRFLLEDYTVTHNTEIACAVTQYLGLNTLFIVTTRELLHQARKRFISRLGADETQVGIIGDGNWLPGSWVTIATLDTLESRMNTPECQDFLKSIEVMFSDEAHHVGSEKYYTISTLCRAYYRYGLSGTPLDRTDGADLRLIAATGEKIVDINNKFLVERGISAQAHVIFDKVTEPVVKKKSRYPTVYKQGVVENPNMLSKIVEWAKIFYEAGLGCLILCEEIQHGRLIDDALWTQTDGIFIPHQFIYGGESSETRQKALDDFASRNLPVLIASTILDEGVDVPTIDALILAGSRKSRIRTMQRLGRGLRGQRLVVVDFANFCHKYLIEHSLQRMEDFKNEECFPIYNSGPDPELVKSIWEDK